MEKEFLGTVEELVGEFDYITVYIRADDRCYYYGPEDVKNIQPELLGREVVDFAYYPSSSEDRASHLFITI